MKCAQSCNKPQCDHCLGERSSEHVVERVEPYGFVTPAKSVHESSMLMGKGRSAGECTSNEQGYQRCPERPRCELRTGFVNSGLQYAVQKLRRGNGDRLECTNLQMTIASTIMASICSLLPSVQDIPPRRSDKHQDEQHKNWGMIRTVLPKPEVWEMTHPMNPCHTSRIRPVLGVSDKNRCSSK